MTNKQGVVETIQNLPDDATLVEIREEVENITAILESEEDEIAGRVFSNEQVMEEMRPGISK
ncbi:MAG: hypothetical protein EXS09_11490 [Gemmataceae bacterium]|nr:hypothetical protein [Gemmataceae bacterium]